MSTTANWDAVRDETSGNEPTFPSLPVAITSRDGFRVDLTAGMWRVPANREKTEDVTLPVFRLDRPAKRGSEMRDNDRDGSNPDRGRSSMLSAELAYAMRLYLAFRLTRYAPRSVRSHLSAFLHFERYLFDEFRFRRKGRPLGPEDITVELVETYRGWCETHLATKGSYPYAVAQLYQWSRRRGYPGFSRRVDQRLRGIRFEGSLRGHIARIQCPRRGAFEFEERVQIDEAIRAGAGRDSDRAVVFLFQQLGIRTEAAVLLRRRHLEAPTHPGEHWWLHVPKAKQRGGVRSEVTTRRRISARLGEALQALPVLEGDDPPLLPLTRKNKRTQIRYCIRRWVNDADLITDRLTVEKGGWRSPQKPGKHPDKARLPVFPYRFRRTIAMMLANQGADAATIAAALDDKTLGMASVYAQSSSTMVDVLARTLDRHPEWVRVIKLFRGEIADDDDTGLFAILGGIPQFARYDQFADIGVIGFCANGEPCTLFPPLSCYRCPFFRAVPRDVPHRRQLAQIQVEIEDGVGKESDRMVSILERDAAAIVDLVALISQRKGPVGKALDEIASTQIGLRIV